MKVNICNMVSHIKNAAEKGLTSCLVVKSKFMKSLLEVLKSEGYIEGYEDDINQYRSKVYIKYSSRNISTIKSMKMISTPSRCFYFSAKELRSGKYKLNRFATVILSTNCGILPDYVAAKQNIGGIAILEVAS